ncbi:MAG: DUF58 domain-containing protein [Planctomycetota bacterium]
MKPTLVHRREARQAHLREREGDLDPRVYDSLHRLSNLQGQARGVTFLPRRSVHSLLSGRRASRLRGRGLNFEEIRAYHPGDDIRTIDWKVTARMRSPHARVFTEERDRPALVLIDQRIDMFYGTRWLMKSVAAAEAAALAAWGVLEAGDRVGAILFNDGELREFRPRRSRANVVQILGAVAQFNQALRADLKVRANPAMLNRALEAARRAASHDFLVVLVSDFSGVDQESERRLLQLSRHNDVIAALVHDPSASKLPMSREFAISDGELQVELPLGNRRTRERLERMSQGRIANVLGMQQRFQMPVLPISAGEEVVAQLQRLLGQANQVGSSR